MLSQKLKILLQNSTIRLSIQQNACYGRNRMTPLSRSPMRPHLRRVFEAIGEPILPTDPQFELQKPASVRCRRPQLDRERLERKTQLSPRALAIRNHLRKNLLEATVVIVCHEHPTDPKTQHYDLQEMASEGVAFVREQEAKVIRSLLQGTTLEGVAMFFDDDAECLTSLMYTKKYVKEEDDGRNDVISGKVRDENYLPLALRHAKKINWVVPLAVVYEDRILTVQEAESFVGILKNPLGVRAETVAVLNSPMQETGRLLNEQATALTSSLQSRAEQLKNSEETTTTK